MISIRRLAFINLLIFSTTLAAAAQGGRNSIEGRITGTGGKGIEDARVVLKNQNLSDVAQDITDVIGNYRFLNVADGVYYIEVLPVGTGYEGRTLRVELFSLSSRAGGSADVYHFDMELRPYRAIEKPLPKKLADALAFVQEVPEPARQKYKEAEKALQKEKKEEAYALLIQAIETFPNYYDALDLLGMEYLAAKHFNVAVPLFLQAVDVNPKGWHSYYGLAVAYGNLSMRKEAMNAARKAIDLNPMSARAHVQLGTELAKDKDSHEEAIKSFQKAVELEPIVAAEAYLALASLYVTDNKYKEAADALQKYLDAAPNIKDPSVIKNKIKELRKKAGP